jgi:hypothetical protein
MTSKGWPKTWPSSTRSAEAPAPQRQAVRRSAACLLPAAAEALAGPPSLQKVFGRSGTLCRPLLFKGRRQDPPQPKRLPLAQHRVRPSFLRSFTLRIGTMAVTPSASLYSPLQPLADAFRRTFLQGFGASCLRAPGLRLAVRDRHTTCTHGLPAIRGRAESAAPHMHRVDSAQANTPTPCIDPTRKASRCADRSSVEASRPGRPLLRSWPKALGQPP